ncbi:MAG: hypothetical protein MK106_09385 [Mariniblastus sp.]|nr:hypothetical protein [Mariniblastus sp.]
MRKPTDSQLRHLHNRNLPEKGEVREPSESQLRYLRSLGYEGDNPETLEEASNLIEVVKDATKNHCGSIEDAVRFLLYEKLELLKELGYRGLEPKSLKEVFLLIDAIDKYEFPANEAEKILLNERKTGDGRARLFRC